MDLSPDNSKFVPPATDINRTLVEHSQFEASPPGTQWRSAWTRRQYRISPWRSALPLQRVVAAGRGGVVCRGTMATLQKIKDIEDELARTQVNKATMGHICRLKSRLAKLKRELLLESTKASGGGGGGEGFDVARTGDARVAMIGFPSVGKSTLFSKLTETESEVAAYEFTTLTAIPSNIFYRGAKIQLIDLPGIIEGAKEGRGRGRQVIAVARSCDLIMIVLDATKPVVHKRIIERELEGFGIRLGKQRPRIAVRRKDRGGVTLTTLFQGPASHLDLELCRTICQEYRCPNAEIVLKEDATPDDLIDVLEGNRVYVPVLYVLNKIDATSMEELELYDRLEDYVPISGHLGWNLDGLLEEMWKKLDLIRIYTKPKGEIPDYDAPIVLRNAPEHCTVRALCRRIHKSLLDQMRYAWVWGSSVKFSPQKVGADHVLQDEDVVQIVKS